MLNVFNPLPKRAHAVGLALFLALTAFAMMTPGAGAHAELERSSPPSEGLLAVPPSQIDLWFTERVDPADGALSVKLLDDQGAEIPVAADSVDSSDPTHVIAEIDDVPPGVATVVWSVRSLDDGHSLSGTFAFRVGSGRAPGSASVEGERPRAWAVATRWLTFLGAAIAAGGFAFELLVLGARGAAYGTRRRSIAIGAGAAFALLGTLLEPVLQTRWPPAGIVAPSLADAISGLPTAWWWRPAGAAGCLVLAGFGALRGGTRPRAVQLAGVGMGLAALLGLSLTGHGSARETWRALAIGSDIAHQWSVALWVGGLAHLALWWPFRREGDGVAGRFSRLVLPLAGIATLTGVLNAGMVLPAIDSLWSSDYGWVVVAKAAVFLMPLGLAAFNRRAIHRAAGQIVPALRRTVRVEVALLLVVVLGGSTLAMLAPPLVEADRPVVADVPMPALAAYRGQDVLVHLRFSPGKPGENTTAVRITNWDGSAFTGEAPAVVRLGFSNIEVEAPPDAIDATLVGDGDWTVRGSRMSYPGWWRVDVTVRWLGERDVVIPFVLLMPDPNLNGLDAPDDDPPSDPAAAALYTEAMANYTGVHRVTYAQAMASHQGTVSYGVHVVNDGNDGSEPGYTFDIPGGWQYVVLGSTAWSKRPGEAWEASDTNPMIPPDRWDDEYTGARGFQLGRIEEIDGEACRILTFVVPESQRQVVAWYVWWVGTESGRVRREMMISQSHYMRSDFRDFDAPVTIEPPIPASATPAP